MKDELLRAHGKKEIDKISYWVYTLRCYNRFRCDNFQDLKRRAENRIGREPEWLRQAWEANKLIYVGQTEDLEKRLGQHFENKMSSDFTTLFEPHAVIMLIPKNTRNAAEYEEERIGQSYYGDDDTFAYWA